MLVRILACDGKENVFTRDVKHESDRVEKSIIREMWGKKCNIHGESKVWRYIIYQKTGSE